MLSKLYIKAFKSIEDQEFNLAPMTILTGTNSSGKSSVIQAAMLALASQDQDNQSLINELVVPYADFESSLCRWSGSQSIEVSLKNSSSELVSIRINSDNAFVLKESEPLNFSYENNYFYLAANRIGEEEISKLDKTVLSGSKGQFLLGAFEARRNKAIHIDLQHPEATTPNLKAQLAFWLQSILDQDIEFESKKIAPALVQNTFKHPEIGEISPKNVGAGNSYLAKLLILGLLAEPGCFLIIENPEIHLHPKAQAGLARFFCYLSARGVQLLIETHSEHFLNSVRYEVYQDKIKASDISIYYKSDMKSPFIELLLNSNGHYVDKNGKISGFPKGFFDATLDKLVEIG